MKTNYTFDELADLWLQAENFRNFGMTIILFDDLSGKVVSYTEDCQELEIFEFKSIPQLFHGFHQLSLPDLLPN